MGGELRWDEVSSLFGKEGSCILEGWVEGAGLEGWRAVLDLVTENGWRGEYSVTEGDPLPLPSAEALFDRPVGGDRPRLRVWPHPEVLVIFDALSVAEVDFDVDICQLQGQERVDVLGGFLGAVGRRLRRPVVLVSEGDEGRGRPLIGFDVGRDRVLLRPNGQSLYRT
ncbi:hypothetical protein ACFYYB_20880 [Streptomyces sp. NPDC002886]|uniref:hypothetical protein n=1 Tax=Streptomyces sp. NPDC002886 TaxID=3364667 RepID=UPI0036944BC4